jgi:hypothetical protein
MTVAELVALLLAEPDQTRRVVLNDVVGIGDVGTLERIRIAVYVRSEHPFGQHEHLVYLPKDSRAEQCDALLINIGDTEPTPRWEPNE